MKPTKVTIDKTLVPVESQDEKKVVTASKGVENLKDKKETIEETLVLEKTEEIATDQSVQVIPVTYSSSHKTQYKSGIDESNFLSRGTELCQMAQMQNSSELLNMFRSIFGLERNEITVGFEISSNQRDSLFDYICHEMHGCSYENITVDTVDKYFVTVGSLNISFDAILSIVKKRHSGWLNDEVRDLFMDSVNLMNGFVNTDNLPEGSPIYALGAYMITQLYKFSTCHPNPEVALDLNRTDFEDKLHTAVSTYGIRSIIANIIKTSNDQPNEIDRFYANLCVSNVHYCSVFIDKDFQSVETCDSIKNPPSEIKDTLILMRKWIAKSMSIIAYYVDDTAIKGSAVYFGPQDMLIGDTFEIKDEKGLSGYGEKEFMYEHYDKEKDDQYPLQNDGINCGVFSLWYLLIECYKGKTIVSLDSDRFRDQLLLYTVCLHLYQIRANQKGYTFPTKFEWRKFVSKKHGNSELHSVIQEILQDQESKTKQKYFISGIEELNRWGWKFKSAYSKPSNFFYRVNLHELMSSSFPDLLQELAWIENANVEFQVYWNLKDRRKKQDEYKALMKEIFVDDEDHQYFDSMLLKNNSILVAIHVENKNGGLKRTLAFGHLSTITKARQGIGLVILDYLGCSDVSPTDILPEYDYERFRGKGIGSFLMNMIQVISNVLCEGKDNVVLLKANKETATFYQPLGFKKITSSSKWMTLTNVKKHFKHFSYPRDALSPYALDSKTQINHLRRKIINHIEQSLDNVDFTKYNEKKYLYKSFYEVFQSRSIYQEMKDKCRKCDFLLIPVGKVIRHLFQQEKAVEFQSFIRLYETLFSNLLWVLEPNFKEKGKPSCNVCFDCNACGKHLHDSFEIKRGMKVDTDTVIKETKTLLGNMLNEHFTLDEEHPYSDKRCAWLNENNNSSFLTELRDKEWLHVGKKKEFRDVSKQLFEKLVLLFVQAHVEVVRIVDFFPWDSLHSRSHRDHVNPRYVYQPRLASLVPMKVRQEQLLNDLLGKTDKKKKAMQEQQHTKSTATMKNKVKRWRKFIDDLVFLKHLDSIMYVDCDTFRNFRGEILNKVKNKDAYGRWERKYYVGFPDPDQNKKALKKYYASDSTQEAITNTPEYDTHTIGSIRFLNEAWVDKNCTAAYKISLSKNTNRKQKIQTFTRNKITNEMTKLREMHCTHIYKFTCPVSLEHKFCNAVMNMKRGKTSSDALIAMKGDIITSEWLYEVAVTMHNNHSWYRSVMDPKVTNQFFELPVGAAACSTMLSPSKVEGAPALIYPQKGDGSCGVSAFASAFYYLFDKDLGANIINKKEGYMNCLSAPAPKKSKKAASMKFLVSIVTQNAKLFKDFYVERKKQIMDWKDVVKMQRSVKTIQLCIIQTTSFSRDHIIALAGGWIFDSNLTFAIPLNANNLNWCANHGKQDVYFEQFIEQVEVGKKK